MPNMLEVLDERDAVNQWWRTMEQSAMFWMVTEVWPDKPADQRVAVKIATFHDEPRNPDGTISVRPFIAVLGRNEAEARHKAWKLWLDVMGS